MTTANEFPCRRCRRLRSFDLLFNNQKQNQKIAAYGSSYTLFAVQPCIKPQLVRQAASIQDSIDHQLTQHDHLMQHQHGPAL